MGDVHVNNGALTHPGQVRTNNEDAFLVEGRLFVVADGMGDGSRQPASRNGGHR